MNTITLEFEAVKVNPVRDKLFSGSYKSLLISLTG